MAPGSMPGSNPSAAVKVQLRAFPEIPAWPQLPGKSVNERMNLQGLAGLPGLNWANPEKPVFTAPHAELRKFLETLKAENQGAQWDRAAFQKEEAAGFYAFLSEAPGLMSFGVKAVKGQCIGPVSLGLGLLGEDGKPLLGYQKAMEVVREYLLMHARWQVRQLAALKKPVVFFLDEPSFNSSFQPQSHGLEWGQVQGWIGELAGALQEEGVMVGLHCCGPGPWDKLLETPVELFHLDGFQYLKHAVEGAEGLKAFYRKGGIVIWGMVPTSKPNGSFPKSMELLDAWTECFQELVEAGIRKEDLTARSFFSTSCGLGNSSREETEEAIRCLGELVALWNVSPEIHGMPGQKGNTG